MVYWPTGILPIYGGDARATIYIDCGWRCRRLGKLKWYSVHTHDTHDWDANEAGPIDAPSVRNAKCGAGQAEGSLRLDRTTGEFMAAKPFVEK